MLYISAIINKELVHVDCFSRLVKNYARDMTHATRKNRDCGAIVNLAIKVIIIITIVTNLNGKRTEREGWMLCRLL